MKVESARAAVGLAVRAHAEKVDLVQESLHLGMPRSSALGFLEPGHLGESVDLVVIEADAHFSLGVRLQAGAGTVKWVVAFLAVFMVFAMWVFPEAKRHRGNGS